MKLPPPQREPGTCPNPSGDRAPVTKSVPRAQKAEPAPATQEPTLAFKTPAETASSSALAKASVEIVSHTPTSEPKKKKAAPKKKVVASASEQPAATPEAAPAASSRAPEAAPGPAATPDTAPTAPEPTSPDTLPSVAPASPEPTSPADSPPATPPTDTTPPATPPETTPTTPQETPPAASATTETKKGFFDSITSSFRGAADRFMARFLGKMTEQDEEDYETTWSDVGSNGVIGLLSVAASYGGVKLIYDLPAWFWQKVVTNPAERQRIKDAFKAKETELDASDAGETPDGKKLKLEKKKLKLEEIINISKFITKEKEKKKELLKKLKDAIEMEDRSVLQAIEKRDKQIATLLDEAIQSRVSTLQMLKEVTNTALVWTGVLAIRAGVYGVVSLAERYQTVSQERKEGKRIGGQFNEWIIKGFTETAHKLVGGGAKTWVGRGLNAVQGATTVLRAAGIGGLAIDEIMQEGGVSNMIETSLKAWEEKSAGQFTVDNMKAPRERLGSLFGKASDAVTGAPETPPVPPGTDAPDLGTSDASTGQDLDASGEPTGAVAPLEYPESVIATGTVQKGDGIIEILQRQGLSAKEALAAARETGIVRPGGDTRLATESIGRIAILVHETDGRQVIEFHDAQTGDTFSLNEARAQGFTYEHGSGSSVSAPAETAPISDEPEPVALEAEVPEAERLFVDGHLTLNHSSAEGFSLSMDSLAPNETLLAMTDAGAVDQTEITGQIESTKELSQKMTSEMALLEKLDKQGLGDSPEAHLIRMDLKSELFNTQYTPGIFKADELAKITAEVQKYEVDKILAVTTETNRIADIRIPGLGKIEFTYDASGNPEFNFNQLIENAKPVLDLRAQNMLVTGWQDTLAENYVTRQEMDVAGPVYLMNKALNQLKAGGESESAEAKFLVGKLAEFLRANANVLDGNNSIVKEAAEKAGLYMEIFQS